MGKPLQAMLRCFDAQLELSMPAIGRKKIPCQRDLFMDMDVVPTLRRALPVSHTDSSRVLSPEFKKSGNMVIAFKHRKKIDMTPDFKNSLKIFEVFEELSDQLCILSASTVKHKGYSEAILKMCFGNMIGFELLSNPQQLFNPAYCDIVAEIDFDKVSDISLLQKKYKDIDISILGRTIIEPYFIAKDNSISLNELIKAYTDKYEPVFTTKAITETPQITNDHMVLIK